MSADPIFQSGSTRTSRPVSNSLITLRSPGRENAEPSDGRRSGCLHAVQDKPSLDAHRAGLSVAPKRPSLHDSASRADDDRVVREVAGNRWSPGPGQISGRRDDDAMHRSDLAGDGRGVVKNANAHSDVDRFAH